MLRIIIFISGALTIFFYFFSIIGIVIGLSFIIFSRRDEWKAHGVVLSLGITFSNWISNTGIEMEPLKLAAIAGPATLIVYFSARYIINILLKRDKPTQFLKRLSRIKIKPWPRRAVLVLAIIIPVFMWQSVSINYGVLFNNSPQLLWVHAPITADRGEKFQVQVQCWDPYERLSAVYRGEVSFGLESYDINTLEEMPESYASLPVPFTFTGQERCSSTAYLINDGKDNGQRDLTVSIDTAGIHYIKVTDNTLGKTFCSNPIIVSDIHNNDLDICWGDLHSHSILSDGSGSFFHNTSYGRDISCGSLYP